MASCCAAHTINNHFFLWNAETGRLVVDWGPVAGRALAFSPDGKTLAQGLCFDASHSDEDSDTGGGGVTLYDVEPAADADKAADAPADGQRR